MNPKSILRIAKWESERATPTITPKQLLAGVLTLGIIASIIVIGFGDGFVLGSGLYTIGVSENSPYHEPVSGNPVFAVEEPNADAFKTGELDILIRSDGTILVADTKRGSAAATEFKQTISAYNDRRMQSEEDQTAAFPVEVYIQYINPDGSVVTSDTNTDSEANTENTDTPSNWKETIVQTAIEYLPTPILKAFAIIASTLQSIHQAIKAPLQGIVPSSGLSSPFPFQSVVLALLFIIPMNFVAQTYGSSMMSERLNRRGELLLVSPASSTDIIIGKTIPYIAGMIGVSAIVSLIVGGGATSVLAVFPFAIAFLGGVFLSSMLARSFKELTFATITISVAVIGYAFIPAMFTNIHPIAIISPLTLIVQQLEGTAISTAEFLFATIPLTFVGVMLFVLGAGLYREETLFTQRPIREKILDSFSNWVTKKRHIPIMTAALLPFVFAAELMTVTLVYPLSPKIGMVVLLLSIAVIEEIAKTLPIYAALTRNRFPRTYQFGAIAALLTGLGFYLAEKVTALAQYVGLYTLDLGQMAFGTLPTTPATGPVEALALMAAPLILHIGASSVALLGAAHSRKGYFAGLIGSILIHASYDFMVVMKLA